MSHEVETMAYAGEKPWHGLGFEVSNKLTPAEMLKAAKLDWTVSKKPLFTNGGGSYKPVTGHFALMRDSDDSTLDVVGATYKPAQNIDTIGFFKKFVEAGKMKMETAGSLMNGRYIWALAKIEKSFLIGKDDKVEGYVLLCSPHILGKALLYQTTAIRVVCWNTLQLSLGLPTIKGVENETASGSFRMSHAISFDDDVKKRAEEALGLATQQMNAFETAVKVLSKVKAPEPQVEEFFFEVLRLDEDAREERKEEGKKDPRIIAKFQQALTHAPGQQLPGTVGTWWGALNAVTYVIDHETGRTKDTALKGAWLGGGARKKARALDLAMQKAAA